MSQKKGGTVRETFGSRFGFILISAGCAIGLGNVWRFPYITGKYGGGIFVIIYLFFLITFGLPIMIMEYAVGRGSRKSVAASFRELEPEGTKWHLFSYFAIAGNYLLMMFYTTIGGFMFAYFCRMIRGELQNLTPAEIQTVFDTLLQTPVETVGWMLVTVLIGFSVCSLGLRDGVERISKVMMVCLLSVMLILAVRSMTLPGADEGLRFYLLPNLSRMLEQGIGDTIFAAMGQAFFTLSIGVGSMAIFGSYIDRNHTLTGEALRVTALDTAVALITGLIIFPACFAFGVNPGSGQGLVFVTLPNIFNSMPGGRIFGTLFFVFMIFAALSTIIAVFENILSFAMDLWGWTRKKAVLINLFLVSILSLPAALGFSVLSGFQPFGPGSTISDLEDFIVSNNLLPLGSLVYLTFCVTRYGWGFKNFLAEADAGKGLRFPAKFLPYFKWLLPFGVLLIFIQGYFNKFFEVQL